MRILVADNHEDGMFKCRGELLQRLTTLAEVYVSVPEGRYTQQLLDMGCCFKNLKIDRRGMNPFSEIKLLVQYSKLLKEISPDIVLTYSIKPNVYLGYLCSKRSIPFIPNITGLGTSLEDGGVVSLFISWLYRVGIKHAEVVLFQNRANLEYMKRKCIVGDNIELIPGSGVNLSVHNFEAYPEETDDMVFLTIGRIMKDKGIDELLEAAGIVKTQYPKIEFRLVGFFDGEYKEKIEDAEGRGLIKYCGHTDDVHLYIKNSHAIIHPSYHEGMANALLESAATGRPVIATDVPGCIETFEPYISGIPCKAKDSRSLADAITKFIELPYSQKVAMGLAARKKVEKEFDREIVINKYLSQIKRIMEKHGNENRTL